MNIQKIKPLLYNQNIELLYYEKTTSTNIIAKEIIREIEKATEKEIANKKTPTCKNGAVIFAGEQSGGRGRFDRKFHSPPDTGIYMSVILKDVLDVNCPEKNALFTPAAAVAVCRAVSALAGKSPKIKWVNDVLIDGKKICGILTEAAGTDAIVGIGINYSTDFSDFPELNAASVFAQSETPPCSREELAAGVINELMALSESIKRGENLILLGEYRGLSCLIGEHISYMQNNEKRFGTVKGIDDSARLLVETPKGETTALCSGEVFMVRGATLRNSEKPH